MPTRQLEEVEIPLSHDSTLHLERVNKVYQRGNEQVMALKNVTFSLTAGTVLVIFGPSGGGKSTLLHLLGGMDRPSSGQILFKGQDIGQWRSDQLAHFRRETVGFIFQSFHLVTNMSARENVELPLMMAGVPKPERRQRAVELLTRVGKLDPIIGPRSCPVGRLNGSP